MAGREPQPPRSTVSLEQAGFIVAGGVVGVLLGDALFPGLTLAVAPPLRAALHGGGGAILGLVAHRLYVRARER